jgi:UDP-2,3-diacylglucosamine pyrophosphatase LpxH
MGRADAAFSSTADTTMAKDDSRTRRYRTIWISDVHLGTPGCKADFLVDFLRHNDCDTLYLVGDIIDGWKLATHWFWPQEHTNVIRKVLTKAQRGTRVIYVTGNHDEFLRKFVHFGLDLGNLTVVNEALHLTADGRRLLVLHGDLFDVVIQYHRWIALAGDAAYELLMRTNYWINRARALMGKRYWSLSAFAKKSVKNAVNIISEFEENVARECSRRELDGVVCGHIHQAEARNIGGTQYYNCGDWVESCSALVEHTDGCMEVLRWVETDRLHETAKQSPPRLVLPEAVGS